MSGYELNEKIQSIIEAGWTKFRQSRRGVRGQAIMPQDDSHWWVVKEALEQTSDELEQARKVIAAAHDYIEASSQEKGRLIDVLSDYEEMIEEMIEGTDDGK